MHFLRILKATERVYYNAHLKITWNGKMSKSYNMLQLAPHKKNEKYNY